MSGDSPPAATARSDGSALSRPSSPVVTIRPVVSRIRLRELVRQRALIYVIADRDIKVKFKQSLLGPVWLLGQPFAFLLGFVVGIGSIAHIRSEGVPYGAFVLVGATVWSYFQTTTNMGAASIISNYPIVRKTPCPRHVFPLASLITNLPALAVPALGSVIVAAALDQLSVRVLLLPLAFFWLLFLTAGITIGLSALATRFRDTVGALPLLLQAGVFLSPIGYPIQQLPIAMRVVLTINPLSGVIEFWRWTLLRIHHPDVTVMFVSLVLTPVIAWFGWQFFGRTEVIMADIV
jgi:lipopolysaccharide transport system permease protein